MGLVGKKVRVRVDNYDADTLLPKFIKFLEDSKGKVFTAMQGPKYKGTDLYCLEEEPIWVFFVSNLEVVKFEGEL